jgi:hypothetical protein
MKEREEVPKYWGTIKILKQENKSITDEVLTKLLPYNDTRHNRERGYRISVAPVITGDVKKWFENVRWQTSDNWDKVAESIYKLIYGLIENEDWESLKEFENNQSLSRGFKAGFLTPTFYFLNKKYRIINNKVIDTINYLYGKDVIGRDLKNYREYLEIIDESLKILDIHLFDDSDNFDIFCHWMCDKSLGGYARPSKPEKIEGEPEEPELFEAEEPQTHWEAVYYIVQTGKLLGYKTYVADRNKTVFEKKLGEIADLIDIPSILKSAPEINRIDVIWFKPTPPFFFFEVEDRGTMREALHRLYNSISFDARFFIVSPEKNINKFQKWVKTTPFSEYEDRYNFRTYKDMFDFYNTVSEYIKMRNKYLGFNQ